MLKNTNNKASRSFGRTLSFKFQNNKMNIKKTKNK